MGASAAAASPGASKGRDPGLSPGVGGWSLAQTGVFPTHLRSQSEASPAAPPACTASSSSEPHRRALRPLYPCWPPAGHVRITAEQLGPQDRVPVAPGSSRAHRALGYPLLMRVPSLDSQCQHPGHTDKRSLSPCGLGSPGPRNMRAGPAEAGLTSEPLCLGCERHNQKTLPTPARPGTSGPGQPHAGPPPTLGPLGSQVSGVLTTLVNGQRDLEAAGFSTHPGVLPGPDGLRGRACRTHGLALMPRRGAETRSPGWEGSQCRADNPTGTAATLWRQCCI